MHQLFEKFPGLQQLFADTCIRGKKSVIFNTGPFSD